MTVVAHRPALIACADLNVMETFAEVLIRRRMERGWTLVRLAQEAGVSRHAIWTWETDRAREPAWPYRLALREALGLTATDDGGWWDQW